jgi:hypothetical protein
VFPVGIGLRDPRSQKRDLGAPFDFTLRCCRGNKLCHFSPDSLSPTRLLPRHARAGGMTKGRATLPWIAVAGQKVLSTVTYPL